MSRWEAWRTSPERAAALRRRNLRLAVFARLRDRGWTIGQSATLGEAEFWFEEGQPVLVFDGFIGGHLEADASSTPEKVLEEIEIERDRWYESGREEVRQVREEDPEAVACEACGHQRGHHAFFPGGGSAPLCVGGLADQDGVEDTCECEGFEA